MTGTFRIEVLAPEHDRSGFACGSDPLDRYLLAMEKLFWPDLIVLGGGASKKLDKFAARITVRTPVVPARFLNQAGMIGAALFAEEKLKAAG